MQSVRIELAVSEEALGPLHERFCQSPALDREVILGGQAVDGVETVSSFVYGDLDAYETLLADIEPVREYDLTPSGEGFFVYLRRELGPGGASLMDSLSRDTLVVVPPIEVRSDRTMRMTLVGHPADLRSVTETLPEGMSPEVLRVGSEVAVAGPPLTDRQRRALLVAREVGYYEIPRRNGIEAVADELDCAVSTASELIRRAEASLVDHALQSGHETARLDGTN